MPQLNYKIPALEQVLETAPLKQTNGAFYGKNLDICFDHITFGYEKTQPGPDGKPMVTMDEVITDVGFTVKAGQKTALVGESGFGKSMLAKLLIHYGGQAFREEPGKLHGRLLQPDKMRGLRGMVRLQGVALQQQVPQNHLAVRGGERPRRL